MCLLIALRIKQIYILNQLMSPANHLQLIGVIELLADILAESVACASGTDAPPASVVRVAPE